MKIQLKSKLLSILLVLAMLLTLGLGIGLQNSLVLKVYATEPDNALANIAASELQIVLHKNDHSTVNTTFAGGKYLHINGATGIEDIESTTSTESIYNIQGQKMNSITQGGIYIVNGKKVIMNNKNRNEKY